MAAPVVFINFDNVLFINRAVPRPQPFLPLTPAFIPKFRVDLRALQVFSIDPIDSVYIDDALHCKELSNGNYEVGVHIADVTQYIHAESSIDKEACRTGKSVRMINPSVGKLCSLDAKSDKPAFSVIWEITPNAKIISIKYTKSLIRSRIALSYGQVQKIIDNDLLNDEFTIKLKILNNLSKCFRNRRIRRGAVVQYKEDAKMMMEEFMILANICVAEKIYKHFPQFSLLRRLPKPNNQTSSTNKVKYLLSENMNIRDLNHDGIGKYLYTHFTSPIRRYADVHVHRLLAAALGIAKVPNIFLERLHCIDIINKLNSCN